ncbi:MAG: hypothetical protein QXE97_04540 [Candidatus Aenigmatarchaeota archaeon]
MTNYKKLLENFLKEKSNRSYALPIVERLLQQRLRKGHYIIKGKMKVHESELENNMLHIFESLIEKCVREDKKYDASLIPTIISPDQAPNFYLGRENPTEDEIYRFLYLIISGIYRGEYIVNLDNVDERVRSNFRKYLINEKLLIFPSDKEKGGIDLKKLMNAIGIKVVPPLNEFIYSFILISSFVTWIKKESLEIENWKKQAEELGIPSLLEKIGIRDDVALVICYLPKQKKEMYFVPKLKSFISKWYGGYLTGREDYPFIVKFIFSTYIPDKQYRELSSSLLNKFLYYFLNGYVNGELLDKLINLKISYELKEKTRKVYGFSKAKEFFSKLSENL